MDFVVETQDIWVATLRDRPGGLAEKLLALRDVGADLDFVIARRSAKHPGAGVVFVTPLRSDREIAAATEAGFNVSTSLHALRIQGADRPGIAAEVTQRLAEEGISLNGFSAAVSGPQMIINLAVDSLADRNRVREILETWIERAVPKEAPQIVVPISP